LSYVIHTIATQNLVDGDEVIVIGDGKQYEIWQIVEAIGPPFRYAETNPSGDWGHSQLNYGLDLAKGDYILCTDDDDGYFSRAFETVRGALEANQWKPHLFRFYSNDHLMLWKESDHQEIKLAHIGGHNLVCPNVEGKKSAFAPTYRGDFDWVKGVLDCYPKNDWIWREEFLTRQRPNRSLLAWPVRTDEQFESLRIIRNECRSFMTRSQDEIGPSMQAAFSESLRSGARLGWPFLYTERAGKTSGYLGYSYLSLEGGKMMASYGVGESHRGKGFGRLIVQHAGDAAMGEVHAESLASNAPILHLQKMQGFREVGRKESPFGEVVVLYRPKVNAPKLMEAQ